MLGFGVGENRLNVGTIVGLGVDRNVGSPVGIGVGEPREYDGFDDG